MRATLIRALLFLFCAVPGVLMFLGGLLSAFAFANDRPVGWQPLLLALATTLAGVPLMFLGTARWGQWRYLYVFLAIPVGMVIGVGISMLLQLDSMIIVVLFTALAPIIAERVVRRSYTLPA